MNFKKLLKFLLGLTSAFFFLWLMKSSINYAELKSSLDNINWGWLALALLALVFGYVIRIQRWKLMLRLDNKKINWISCAGPLLGSFAMNNVLPFRAGDLMRAFAFNKKLEVSPSGVLATLFVERLLDLLMVLVFLIAGLQFFDMKISMLFDIGDVALTLCAIAIVALLIFPRMLLPAPLFMCTVMLKFAPTLGEKLKNAVDNVFQILCHLSGLRFMLTLLIYSFFAWVAEGCVFWFIALSLPSIENSSAAWLALPVGTLSTLIPSTPGYIGTFDFFTSETMQFLHNTTPGSVAFALVAHLVIWAPITIVGGLYMLMINFIYKK
jgi:glycosyltransferase 2 family protein